MLQSINAPNPARLWMSAMFCIEAHKFGAEWAIVVTVGEGHGNTLSNPMGTLHTGHGTFFVISVSIGR